MLWQKAFATTVATATASPSRTHSIRISRRTDVAPSRRLQKAAKSCSPTSADGRHVHRRHVKRAPMRHGVVPAQRVDADGIVRYAV